MANKILLKRSAVANAQPTTGDLSLGELAINTVDGRLYTKIDNGTPAIFDLTQNQPITLTGNITGVSINNTAAGNTTIVTTLSTTGVAAGTYGGTSGATTNVGVFTVDQYGRVTSASNTAISTASLANGTSNIQVLNNGNILFGVSGNANVGVFSGDGLYVNSIIDATGNIVGANVNSNGVVSSSTLSVTGNANVGNLGTAGLIVASGNVTGGNLNTSGRVQTANIFMTGAYLETTAGVPLNIVSGGVGGVRVWSKLVPDGNITRDLGSSTEYWADFYANTATINATVTATGNVTGGNLLTGGAVNATGNVTGGNVVATLAVSAGTTVTATGNVSGGNITTAGQVAATGNVTGGNLATSGTLSVTGNANVGNLGTAGVVTATGNVTGGNLITAGLASIGTTLTVTGNANVGNLGTAGVVTATGNVTGGNVTTAGVVSATGNVIGGNLTTTGRVDATGNVAGGNLTTTGLVSATGNVSGGNVTTTGLVSATGNVSGGNVTTTGRVDAAGNVNGGNLTTSGVVNATGNIISTGNVIAPNVVTSTVTTSSGALVLNSAGGTLQWDGAGNIVMNSQWINNLSDPVRAQDAATKEYVDNAVSTGITIHTPVYVEAPVALPAATYAQGGATYTVTDTIAGNTVVFSTAASLQVNDQLWFTSAFSGIQANTAYFVVSTPNTSAAVLSTVYNGAPVGNITSASGLTQPVRVNSGQGATLTANANGQLTVDGINPSANQRVLVYNQVNAYENGVYVVTQTGNVSAPWILTRSSDTNTYKPEDITGLDAGDYFYVQAGNTGAGESYVMTAPIGPFILGYNNLTFTQFSASQVYTANTAAGIDLSGTVFSAKVDNNTTAFDGNGNIIVKAGANLTTPNIGAATGTSLSVSGNVAGGNITTTGVVAASGNVSGGNITTTGVVAASGNVSGGNLTTVGQASVTGNVTGGNLITAGIVSATGNVSGGNVTTVGRVDATGNVAGGNLTTTGQVDASGNITGGNLITAGLASIGTTLTVTGNANVGNLGTSGLITATGNITGGNLNTGNQVIATGNITGGNLITSGLASVTGNITGGNLTTSGTANVATIIVTTLANITSATAATSTTTGALQVAGGVGVVGNVYAGDVFKGGVTVLNANDTIDGGTY